jgi:transposase
MGRKVLELKNYTTSDIEELFSSEDKYRVGMRLCAVLQLSKGIPSRKLEELYNTSFKQICNWAHRLDNEGILGLYDRNKPGRKSRLSDDNKGELQAILSSKTPETFGYNTATWSGAIVCELIKAKWGIEYKTAQIYNILRTLGFSFQRAKGVYPEADKKRQEEFAQTIKKTL